MCTGTLRVLCTYTCTEGACVPHRRCGVTSRGAKRRVRYEKKKNEATERSEVFTSRGAKRRVRYEKRNNARGMHPSGAFRVQPHFVRSLARSVLRTPRLRVSLRDFKNKNKITCGQCTSNPQGCDYSHDTTRPRHMHAYVCAHTTTMTPPQPLPAIMAKRHAI